MASNFLVNCRIWLEFEYIQDSVLSDNDQITRYAGEKAKYGFFLHSRASNSNINSLIWREFKLVQDFMPALVICKFDEDPMKTERAWMETTFYPLKVFGKVFRR